MFDRLALLQPTPVRCASLDRMRSRAPHTDRCGRSRRRTCFGCGGRAAVAGARLERRHGAAADPLRSVLLCFACRSCGVARMPWPAHKAAGPRWDTGARHASRSLCTYRRLPSRCPPSSRRCALADAPTPSRPLPRPLSPELFRIHKWPRHVLAAGFRRREGGGGYFMAHAPHLEVCPPRLGENDAGRRWLDWLTSSPLRPYFFFCAAPGPPAVLLSQHAPRRAKIRRLARAARCRRRLRDALPAHALCPVCRASQSKLHAGAARKRGERKHNTTRRRGASPADAASGPWLPS